MEIELPDGTIAEFPDDMSPEQIQGVLAKQFPSPETPPAENQPMAGRKQVGYGLQEQIMDGVTLGTADEMVSGLLTLPNMASRYLSGEDEGKGFTDRVKNAFNQTHDSYNEGLDQYAQDYPGRAMAANLGGGFGSGAALLKGGATAARYLPQTGVLAGRLGRMGAGLVDGAVAGGVNAAGHQQNIAEGAGMGGVFGALGQPIAEGVGALGSKIAGAFTKRPPAMTSQQLKEAATDAYNQAEQAGVMYSPNAVKNLKTGITDDLAARGFHPSNEPGVMPALNAMDTSQPTTLKGLDVVRRVAQNGYRPGANSNNAMTSLIANRIDDFAANPGAGVMGGDSKAGASALKKARDYYSRSRKVDAVEGLLERGELNAASSGSGGNADNASRQQLKRLLTSKSMGRGFNDLEKKAIGDAVTGTPGQNALRLAGKLSPQGNGLMMALGGGAAFAEPVIALPTMLAATAAKKGAEHMTTRNAAKAIDLIARGGKPMAPTALQKLLQNKMMATGLARGATTGALTTAY